jgi:putative transposase
MACARTRKRIAGKGYDPLAWTGHLTGIAATIPPRIHLRVQRRYDRRLSRERNKIERFFNKLKHFKHVAMRADKLAINYMAFVKLAAAIISSRQL